MCAVCHWHTDSPGCARMRIIGDPEPASGWQTSTTQLNCIADKDAEQLCTFASPDLQPMKLLPELP
eukprot:10076444-Ditylum_brightwellii.AAC.1